MTRALRIAFLSAALGVALVGCGGPKMAQVKVVEQVPEVVTGPTASEDEVAGKVPPLRPLRDAFPLVPEKLVPPKPPTDPEPVFF